MSVAPVSFTCLGYFNSSSGSFTKFSSLLQCSKSSANSAVRLSTGLGDSFHFIFSLSHPVLIKNLIFRNCGSAFVSVRCGSSSLLSEISSNFSRFPDFLRSLAVLVPETQIISPANLAAAVAPDDPKRCKVRSFKRWPPLIDRSIREFGGSSFLVISVRGFADAQPSSIIGISWIEIFGETINGSAKRATENSSLIQSPSKRVKSEISNDEKSATLNSSINFEINFNAAAPEIPNCRCSPSLPCVSRVRHSSGEMIFLCSSRGSTHCEFEISCENWKKFIEQKNEKKN